MSICFDGVRGGEGALPIASVRRPGGGLAVASANRRGRDARQTHSTEPSVVILREIGYAGDEILAPPAARIP